MLLTVKQLCLFASDLLLTHTQTRSSLPLHLVRRANGTGTGTDAVMLHKFTFSTRSFARQSGLAHTKIWPGDFGECGSSSSPEKLGSSSSTAAGSTAGGVFGS